MSIPLSAMLPNAQWRPRSLAIGPGGMRGYAIMGALEILEDNDKLLGIKHIIGCSVGSVIGYLKMLGYTIKEITNIEFFSEQTMKEIINGTLSDPITLFENILRKGGLIDMEILYKIIQRLTYNKTKQEDITFEELFRFNNNIFTVVVYNKTRRQVEYMNHLYTPNRLVGRSILKSCSVPGVFQQVMENGMIYIDGAIGNPYPVDFLDDGIEQILGIYIEEDQQSSNVQAHSNIISNLMDTISIPILEHRKRIIAKCGSNVKHIAIQCHSTVFLSDDGKKQDLFDRGRRYGEDFLYRLNHGNPLPMMFPTSIIPD